MEVLDSKTAKTVQIDRHLAISNSAIKSSNFARRYGAIFRNTSAAVIQIM
jgi:hypothetical protein